jgi:3-methyl-2-oxobutanoate hydroxymethyltransferase
LGAYRVQRDEAQLLADAQAAEGAGAFAIVLECVPAEAAARITEALKIPTIGIGSGAGCDGQILVLHDLLGLNPGHVPRHVKAYADLKNVVTQAVAQYRDEVRAGVFPDREHAF